ncbi:hypothetical protein [Flavobacterium psychrotrophum]|uniref:hypothetical protein n=1 Tax=Flavobacterium psychrotrophum TaxID=2294119 RepID=UPI000E31E418|nr:hypothetical protein [Flavobacterium psychrotrophum]
MILNFRRTALTLAHLVVFVSLVSCNNSSNTNSDSAIPKEDNSGVTTNRSLMVEALIKLKTTLASKEKEKIAGIFDFPLSDSIQMYTESEAYQKEREQNGDKVSKELFLKYFEEISDDIQMEEVNELFKHINVERLIKQDKLDYENIIATEPCYSFYSIEIKNNLITLSVGSGSNKNYKSKVSSDEVPENSSQFCESVLWWIFSFNSGKLELVSINGAG